MNISVTIMAHPSRHYYAYRLFAKLKKQGFKSVFIMYDMKNNEWRNGKASWLDHGDSDWHIVIQDDAIISDYFYKNVSRALKKAPRYSAVSFYTGTVRPRPSQVRAAVEKAVRQGSSWLTGETLFWGVCVAMPTRIVDDVINYSDKRDLKYDFRIGSYFKNKKIPVLYTNPSLVDHDYTIGSLIGNDKTVSPRMARNYESGPVVDWNGESVSI